MIDIFDLFSGGSIGEGAGAGIFEGLFSGGSAAFDGLGEGVAAAGREGLWELFAGLGESSELFNNLVFLHLLTRDNGRRKEEFAALGEAERKTIERIKPIIAAHGFFLNQLRAHGEDPAVKPLLEEYEAISKTGELPSQELLTKSYRTLSKRMHPDQNGGNKELAALFSELSKSKKIFEDKALRIEYEEARHNPKLGGMTGGIFEDLADGDWKAWASEAARKANPFKAGPGTEIFETPVLEKAAMLRHGAIAFGAVVGTSLLAYTLMQSHQNRVRRDHPLGRALALEPSAQFSR